MSKGGFSRLKSTCFIESYLMLIFVICTYLPIFREVYLLKNSIRQRRSKCGVSPPFWGQILGSCELKGKIQLSIKFYLTNLIFHYISNPQVVKSGKRWYGFLK